jgi:hypothetical protein
MLASTRVPVVNAAGNPLYLHGDALCTPSTLDPNLGTKATPCQMQSQTGGATATWTFNNLPAQTVAGGSWSFTLYWTGGNPANNDTVTVAAGVSPTSSCATFVATVPNAGTTWTATFGANGASTTSPFTVSTSASQLPMVITPGGSLCVSVTLSHNTGGKPFMLYDGPAGVADTQVVPPSIIVPESLLGLVGFVAVIPVFASRLVRRWR